MTGRQYAVTPVKLKLSTTRVNPRIDSILPGRYQQQLQYEPDSAKYFIYRTQLHLQGYSNNNTLPDIRSKSYKSHNEIPGRSEKLLPEIRHEDVPGRSNISRKTSGHSVVNHDSEGEARNTEQELQTGRFKQDSLVIFNSSASDSEDGEEIAKELWSKNSHSDLNQSFGQHVENTDQHNGELEPSASYSGFKGLRRKHKRSKTKSRKSDGRKSRIFNHRLKSAKRNAESQNNSAPSQNCESAVLRYTRISEPLGLLGAKVKPVKVVQRESQHRSANQRLFHSAGRPSDSHNSPRLINRSKTHLALSPRKTPAVRTSMPTAITFPMTPWVTSDPYVAPQSPQKLVNELTIGIQRTSTESPRISQELRKLTKIYLSEKQSGKLQELGMAFPCAPPATPAPEMYEKYEYIPSMGDIRSQRAVKLKLEILERQERKIQEKRQEEKLKREKQQEKERERNNRRRQRKEIYALNKIMTELEHANFKEFCKAKGIDPKI